MAVTLSPVTLSVCFQRLSHVVDSLLVLRALLCQNCIPCQPQNGGYLKFEVSRRCMGMRSASVRHAEGQIPIPAHVSGG